MTRSLPLPPTMPNPIVQERGEPRSYYGTVYRYNPFSGEFVPVPDVRVEKPPPVSSLGMLRSWLNWAGIPWMERMYRKQGARITRLFFADETEAGYGMAVRYAHGFVRLAAWRYDPPGCAYELAEPDRTARWTGKQPCTLAMNSPVTIITDDLGAGRVLDFFTEDGELGVRVRVNQWDMVEHNYAPWRLLKGHELLW